MPDDEAGRRMPNYEFAVGDRVAVIQRSGNAAVMHWLRSQGIAVITELEPNAIDPSYVLCRCQFPNMVIRWFFESELEPAVTTLLIQEARRSRKETQRCQNRV